MQKAEAVSAFIKTIVRPIITVGLISGFMTGAFVNPEAAEKLESLAAMVMVWWFRDRSTVNAPEAGEK